MKNNGLIIKFSVLLILWIGGISLCNAQSTQTECESAGGVWFDEQVDAGQNFNPFEKCLTPSGASGTYCGDAEEYLVYIPEPLSGCVESGFAWYIDFSTPLSDASFLLVFLLGIYGIYTYRKRVAV